MSLYPITPPPLLPSFISHHTSSSSPLLYIHSHRQPPLSLSLSLTHRHRHRHTHTHTLSLSLSHTHTHPSSPLTFKIFRGSRFRLPRKILKVRGEEGCVWVGVCVWGCVHV